MFDQFEIRYDDSFLLTDLVRLGLTTIDVERVFYSDYHVAYPFSTDIYFLIGYSGRMMLLIDFVLNFSANRLTIIELDYATGQQIDDLYCPARL